MEKSTTNLDRNRNHRWDEPESQAGNCDGAARAAQVGDLCPTCQQGRLDYDGTLNLACPTCGAVVNSGGAFT